MPTKPEGALSLGSPRMVGVGQTAGTNVVIVCPWFFTGDAVGASARDTYLALKAQPSLRVTALWTVNDYVDVLGHELPGLAALILDPAFLEADVIIYVFAVYHEMFDAMILGNGRARQVVRFHNVTPKELMPEKHWPIIARSFVQMQEFRFADQIWADSMENLQELERQGLGTADIRVEPLAVPFPVTANLADKTTDHIRLLFVGRFFQSKGVVDLVKAVELLKQRLRFPFSVTLAGNVRFSDPDYIHEVQLIMAQKKLEPWIHFEGSVSPERLAELYKQSHIYATGSRHEGFCVPVVEALAAGCVPVSYNVSNLRYIASGLTRFASNENASGLAEALGAVMSALHKGLPLPLEAGSMAVSDFDTRAKAYVEQFRPEAFRARIGGAVARLGLEPSN